MGSHCARLATGFDHTLFNATAYLLALVKCHGAAGWKWSFRVADFCKEHGLSERSFYRALSKLRTKRLIFWSAGDNISVWWDSSSLALVNSTSQDDCQGGNGSLTLLKKEIDAPNLYGSRADNPQGKRI